MISFDSPNARIRVQQLDSFGPQAKVVSTMINKFEDVRKTNYSVVLLMQFRATIHIVGIISRPMDRALTLGALQLDKLASHVSDVRGCNVGRNLTRALPAEFQSMSFNILDTPVKLFNYRDGPYGLVEVTVSSVNCTPIK